MSYDRSDDWVALGLVSWLGLRGRIRSNAGLSSRLALMLEIG